MPDDAEPQPDWSLLPHAPAQFFGLADPIDRKDLKRAYNKLLRRFKPERAPDEFQRIRAAYEALDERLRYGDAAAGTPQPPVDWNAATDPAPQAALTDQHGYVIVHQDQADAPPPDAQGPSLEERLDSQTPEEVYQQLSAAADKSPYEFYALAVLSDVVEGQAPLRFAEWLLAGLKEHPGCGPLWRLLHDYVRGPLPEDAEATLLPAIAELTRDDSFYPLTEPLWLALLRRTTDADPVDQFARLLERCEGELRGEQITGRMTFYIQLAKATLLSTDHPWPEQTLEYLEANFEHAPPWMEADLDMLGFMRDYKVVQKRFAKKHPVCQGLDAAVRSYFLDEQQQGDRAVVARQVALCEDLDALEAAFPIADNELHAPFYQLWRWISWDVGERNAPPAVEQYDEPQPQWHARVFQLMGQLEMETNASWDGWSWGLASVLFSLSRAMTFLLPAGLVVAGAATVASAQDDLAIQAEYVVVVVAILMGIAVITNRWLNPLIKDRVWTPYCLRKAERLYYKRWRRPVLQLQQRSCLDDREFRAHFENCLTGEISLSPYINLYVQKDYAPAMLSTAQRFLA